MVSLVEVFTIVGQYNAKGFAWQAVKVDATSPNEKHVERKNYTCKSEVIFWYSLALNYKIEKKKKAKKESKGLILLAFS